MLARKLVAPARVKLPIEDPSQSRDLVVGVVGDEPFPFDADFNPFEREVFELR